VNSLVRVIATDIDGTLTDGSRILHPPILSTIREVSNNVPVILATGNSLCFTLSAAILLGTAGKVVAENGAVVSHALYSEHEVFGDKERCLRAVAELKKHLKEPITLLDSTFRMGEVALMRNFSLERAKNILEKIDSGLEFVDTGFAIHVKLKGITKATGLQKILEKVDISLDDVAAVGDSMNDIPMLEACGIALSPANAAAEVKEVCDYVSQKSSGEGFIDCIDWLRRQGEI